jgi:hypothetical protein
MRRLLIGLLLLVAAGLLGGGSVTTRRGDTSPATETGFLQAGQCVPRPLARMSASSQSLNVSVVPHVGQGKRCVATGEPPDGEQATAILRRRHRRGKERPCPAGAAGVSGHVANELRRAADRFVDLAEPGSVALTKDAFTIP